MAQHDYNLANQSGADFRADLNNALSAIATVNSGASEPSTTFAHQLWVDTSNNLLKIRNAANSAFITTGISITADNVFTGALTGNASTATTLETARTINGTSFDGSANISFNTDSVSEGSSNLYFTSERVDDQVNTLLQAGTGIQLTYDDTAGTLTIANTNDADITGVVAGNALTGGGTSGSVTLNVAVDDSSIEIDSDALRVKASGITNTMLAGSIANSKLTNSGVTINSQSLSLGGTLVLDTDNIGEGSSNLYYTDARARAAISENSAQLSYNSTTGVLTYTQGDTDTVSEGSSNLYYTQARFDTAFGNKTTADLTENTNLYYTDARANSAIDARVTNTFINNLSGVVADTSTALATARTIALSGDVVGSVSFDGTADVTIASTIQANSVALGTDTTGNYVQTITGTANKITVSGSGSESADITLTLPDDVQIASDLTVAGNLTVNGTLTSLDTTNLDIEDNLFQLNAGLTGSPVNDSGMLINRGNQNNGIFMWDESVDKFTLGLTTADGTSTGNITLASLGTLVANVEGNVTGTIQTAAQPNITSLGTLTGLTTTGDINFGDNDKAVFGAGSDLEIYHDGSNSFIKDSGTGSLLIDASNLYLRNSSGEEYASFIADGAANLKYNGSTRIVTTSTGVNVTGNVTFDDNGYAIFGASNDLQIYHDGSNSYIRDIGTGNLNILADELKIMNAAGTENKAFFVSDGGAYLYHNNSAKLETTSTGIDVSGTATMDGLTVDGGTTGSGIDVATFKSATGAFNIKCSDLSATNPTWTLRTFSGEPLAFAQGTDERMRLDSSGNLLVGKTSNSFSTAGFTVTPSGTIQPVVSGGSTANFNRLSSDGTIVDFRKDSTTVGSIGTNTGDIFLGTGDTFLRFNDSLDSVLPATATGAGRDNATDLGYSGGRFKDLYLAGTANVNKVSVDGSGANGIDLEADSSATTNSNRLFFSTSAGSNSIMGVSGALTFRTGATAGSASGTERFRLDSSGQLLIGKTASDNTTVGTRINGSGFISSVVDGDNAVLLNRLNSDGSIVLFRKDGTSVGSINTVSDDLAILSSISGHKGLRFGSGAITPTTNTAAIDNGNTDLGGNSIRFKDLYLSGTANTGGLSVNASAFGGIQLQSGGSDCGYLGVNTDTVYVGAGSNLIFHTGNAGLTNGSERMRIDSSGNVGIGGSPSSRLETVGGDGITISNSGDTFLQLKTTGTTATNYIEFKDSGGSAGSISYNHTDNYLATKVNGSERMRIDSSGNLLVGATSFNTGAFGATKGINVAHTQPIVLLHETDTDKDCYIGMSSSQMFIGTADAIPIRFHTSDAEKMRLLSNGSFCIGGTAVQAVNSVSFAKETNGITFDNNTASGAGNGHEYQTFRRNSSQIGGITMNGTTGVSYNTSSDARLKDVTGEARGLEVINELNPVAYNWKADGRKDEGLIAQEVLDIVPNAVTGSEEEMYQMDYSKLVVHLVAGMKEQQTQIEELKQQIQNLTGE